MSRFFIQKQLRHSWYHMTLTRGQQDIHEPLTSFFKSLRDCKKKPKQSVWIWSGDTLSNKNMKITLKKQARCQRDGQQWIGLNLDWVETQIRIRQFWIKVWKTYIGIFKKHSNFWRPVFKQNYEFEWLLFNLDHLHKSY